MVYQQIGSEDPRASVYGTWVGWQDPSLAQHTAKGPGLGICVLLGIGGYGLLREAGLLREYLPRDVHQPGYCTWR